MGRWRRTGTRASSSSTRRRRSPPGTGRAPSAGTPTTSSFLALTGAARADELDERLHSERGRLHEAEQDDLPDGAFVALGGQSWLVLGSALLRWTPGGYSERRPRSGGRVGVVTPPTSLSVLASGWNGSLPLIHPSRPA